MRRLAMKELRVEGKLLRSVTKVVRTITGYGFSELHVAADDCTVTIKAGENMTDLYTDFKDWLDYNHPEVEMESLQVDLVKIALRNWDTKITKTAGKAALKELAKMFFGTKTTET